MLASFDESGDIGHLHGVSLELFKICLAMPMLGYSLCNPQFWIAKITTFCMSEPFL
jgi:hypothetical protein